MSARTHARTHAHNERDRLDRSMLDLERERARRIIESGWRGAQRSTAQQWRWRCVVPAQPCRAPREPACAPVPNAHLHNHVLAPSLPPWPPRRPLPLLASCRLIPKKTSRASTAQRRPRSLASRASGPPMHHRRARAGSRRRAPGPRGRTCMSSSKAASCSSTRRRAYVVRPVQPTNQRLPHVAREGTQCISYILATMIPCVGAGGQAIACVGARGLHVAAGAPPHRHQEHVHHPAQEEGAGNDLLEMRERLGARAVAHCASRTCFNMTLARERVIEWRVIRGIRTREAVGQPLLITRLVLLARELSHNNPPHQSLDALLGVRARMAIGRSCRVTR